MGSTWMLSNKICSFNPKYLVDLLILHTNSRVVEKPDALPHGVSVHFLPHNQLSNGYGHGRVHDCESRSGKQQ